MDLSVIAGRPWLAPIWIDQENDREAWWKSRLEGIGGSDAAAIVGEHPKKSMIDVWNERITGKQNEEEHERLVVGRLLEEPVLGWYAAGGKMWPRPGGAYQVVRPPTVSHRDRPWHRGSADGLAYVPEVVAYLGGGDLLLSAAPEALDHIVELKTHGWFGGRAYDTVDEDGYPVAVPADKRIQCAWYMSLYNVSRCRLVALVDTHLRRTYDIERDLQFEADLLELVDRFWRRNVLGRVEPDPDGSESFSKHIKARYLTHGAHLVNTTPEIDEAIREQIAIKRQQSMLKERKELLDQKIKVHIADALGIRTSIGHVTWKSQASGKLREADARAELYKRCGMTDAEIARFEAEFATPDHRVLRTPSK